LLGELAKLKRGAFTDAELAAARRSLVNEQRAQWEDNEERVLAMVESFGRGERWQDYLDFLAQLDAVDRDQLIRAARTYYGDDFLVLRSRVGFPPKTRLEKPEMRPVEPATGRSPFAGQLAAVPDRPTTPRFIDFNADVETALVTRGVHVQANKNPFNDIYTLELRHGIGMYDLPALEVVDDYLTDVGSATRGADEFKRALFLLATTLEFEATEEEFIVRLSGPEAQLPEALALVDELLNAPAEDGAALRRLCRERWGLNLVAKREPEVIADALREYVTFGRGSTYLRAVSTRELMGTRPRKLVKALQQARRHAVTIRYVGARRAAELAELARAKLHFPARLKPARPPVVRPRKVPKTDQVYWVKRRQSVQTQIILSVDGEPMTAALRPWADAYNEYFGGSMGGLLFQEVRELRALAYAVGGAYLEHAVAGQPGLLLIAAATQADKTLEAITVMRALVQDLPRKADRIPGLRSALVRSQEAAQPGFRALQEYIHAWRLRGFNDDPRRGLLPAYARLELDDIARFHAAHIRDRPQTVMVVGDPRRVSKKELARFGEVHVVPTRKLFSR
ncbi:MAG: insulinase family protein, partial [Myxococcales bacterium]|nr:insulinase family protein [Myxococcales bacterium]